MAEPSAFEEAMRRTPLSDVTDWGAMARPTPPPTGAPEEAVDPRNDAREEAFRALQEAVTRTRSQSDRVAGQLDQSIARSDDIEQRRRAQMDPMYAATIARMQQPRAAPEPPQMPEGKPAPKNDMAEGMSDWVSAMSVIGLLGGALTRRSATTALTAFAAGVEGFAKGNIQKFEQNFQIWKAENETAMRRHELMLRQYEMILRNDNLDVERKRNELMLVAQQWQAQADYEVLRQKGLTEFARNLQQHEFHLERMRNSSERIEMQREVALAKIEAAAAKASGINNIYSPAGLEWIAQQPPQFRRYYEWLLQNKRPDLFQQLMQALPQRPGQTPPPAPRPSLPDEQ